MHLYQEIAEIIKERIFSGSYLPGSKLPSIRAIAEQETCNPATVQRAFQTLKQQGLIAANRTAGYHVINNQRQISQLRAIECCKATQRLYFVLDKLGYSKQEVIFLLKQNSARGELK